MLYEPEDHDGEEVWMVREGEPSVDSRGYRDLKVYRLAHELGVAVHCLSLLLPKYELYETGSQLRRAAKSVSANIVEGYGRRRYKADYLRFLTYAKASLDETEEHLRYVLDCHSDFAGTERLLQDADALGRQLSRYLTFVEANYRV